ncbi:MAG: Pycsar system effector family protein [Acidimicrobiales bacterium]
MRFRWRQRPRSATCDSNGESHEEAFAEVLLDEGREELNRADMKASILLSAAGIIFAALITGVLAGTWTPHKLHRHPAAEMVFWTGLAIGLLGIVLLAWAVLPRVKHTGRRENLAYFGHVVMFNESPWALRLSTRRSRDERGKMELRSAIRVASAGRLDRTVDQVWTISHIVNSKYRRIRWGMLALGMSASLCLGALIANANL